MKPIEKTLQLQQLIYQNLSPLITADYIHLDLPYHSNLGDTLIWQGEIDFLKTLPYKCKYSTWLGGNIIKVGEIISSETIFLLHGGGNFGDVWDEPNDFRKRVLEMYPKQKTIVFPQTVYYEKAEKLKADAEFYAKYPNVTICARDKRSFQILKEHFPNNPSLLVPDMAFCMDMRHYKRCKYPKGSVFIRREDREINENIEYSDVPANSYISDWQFLHKSKEYGRIDDMSRWGKRFDRRFGSDCQHSFVDLYWHYVLRPLNVKTAINLLDKYEYIYTSRMHAAILGVILGKTNITLFDNNYGKSSSFFETWLSDVDGLKLIK